MTKDEALDLALEALEHGVATCFDRCAHEQVMSRPEHFINQAITAIKQARAAQVQEPTAWLQIGLAPFHDGDVIARTSKPKAWNPEWWRFEPLYTTPPAAQRQWVGLTDEAIWSEYQTLWPFHPAEEPRLAKDIAKFARAIEAKLKEKNT